MAVAGSEGKQGREGVKKFSQRCKARKDKAGKREREREKQYECGGWKRVKKAAVEKRRRELRWLKRGSEADSTAGKK